MTPDTETRSQRALRAGRAPALIGIGAALAGALLGVVWGLLAPAVHVVVTHGGLVPMASEDEHRFDAIGMFVAMSAALGVICAAAAWSWRGVRGPRMVVGLVLGCLLGAWLAEEVGGAIAQLRFPTPDLVTLGDVVALRPSARMSGSAVAGPDWVGSALGWLGDWVGLIGQPLAAAVAILLAAVFTAQREPEPEPEAVAPAE